MEDYTSVLASGFERSWEVFAGLVADLDGVEGRGRDHAEVERVLEDSGRALLRQLFQDHLDVRAGAEREAHASARRQVIGADGIERCRVEAG